MIQNKKGGPYTKQQQEKRREKVFDLHFEYGYSAVQIAKMIKVNRNTINDDISLLFSKFREEDDLRHSSDWLNKQLVRLESQRVRLHQELENQITFQEKMHVEKMIMDLDSKITHLVIKKETSKQEMWDLSASIINKWLKKEGKKNRMVLFGDLF